MNGVVTLSTAAHGGFFRAGADLSMMKAANRRTALSFLLAVVLLGGYLWLLGPQAVAAQLGETRLSVFAVGLVSVLVSLVAWSETQRQLLRASGARLSVWRGFTVYNVGMFAKQILPMGHAAGPVFPAYAVGFAVDRPFGENLAPVSIAELQLLVASFVLTAVGLGYLLLVVPAVGLLATVQLTLGIVGAALLTLVLVVWYRRRTVETSLLGLAWFLRVTVGRVSERARNRLSVESVRGGMRRYYATLEMVTADRRRSLLAFGYGVLGWVAFSIPLVTSAAALGADLPLGTAFVLAPAAGIAGLLPLPGGIGSTEIALTALLVGIAGFSVPLAGSITLLYRVCTYWFVVAFTGVFAVYQSALPGQMRAAVVEGQAGEAHDGLRPQ